MVTSIAVVQCLLTVQGEKQWIGECGRRQDVRPVAGESLSEGWGGRGCDYPSASPGLLTAQQDKWSDGLSVHQIRISAAEENIPAAPATHRPNPGTNSTTSSISQLDGHFCGGSILGRIVRAASPDQFCPVVARSELTRHSHKLETVRPS